MMLQFLFLLQSDVPSAESPWWGLVLGPFGALVLSLLGNWVQWQAAKQTRENGRQDLVKLTTALENNTASGVENRRVLERVEKVLDRLEAKL